MSVQTVRPFTDIALRMAIRIIPPIWARAIRYSYLLAAEVHAKNLGAGGLTMATKRVCDRCGAEINPFNSVTYAGMRRVKNDINDNDYELCVSCAHELRRWFDGEKAHGAK